MDEMSWRARLAKSNINILDIHDGMVFLEFTYHPKAGVFKWCKTAFPIDSVARVKDDMIEHGEADLLAEKVLALRKELEG